MEANNFLNFAQKIDYAYSIISEPLVKRFGLPKVSFDILMFLANNPEYKTAQEVSEIRHIKKNLVSVHVEKLVAAGYLRRSEVEGDRRKIGLDCTEKADEIICAGREMQKMFIDKLNNGISQEEWKVHNEVFEKLLKNAEAIAQTEEGEKEC